ncbi:type II 3-dehydroquinate dehydratase [Lysinibacter cavernae]|uniref:3-dehydroquinate dehydratase n=1 Tax=Lysinibacter cavernae TaxID=1640652 RepID=A0A7X5TTG0_9MICO|nr:type II 3-dehydroquinate dehydratase [Lysinibacter cavernae]NIH53243.1 3-dehydroquinate dehydratase-2 [Lysinibacter cavernae]
MTTVLVLNGPNLNRLGTREPEKYGSETLSDLREQLEAQAPEGITIDLRQSNSEAELVGWLHDAVDARTPVILNPAAFTHYSIALRDAAAQVSSAGIELIEVHLTNPHTREDFRQVSYISGVATGIIAGFGFGSYRLALEQIAGR